MFRSKLVGGGGREGRGGPPHTATSFYSANCVFISTICAVKNFRLLEIFVSFVRFPLSEKCIVLFLQWNEFYTLTSSSKSMRAKFLQEIYL